MSGNVQRDVFCLCPLGKMVEFQDDVTINDPVRTFQVPIQFTRTQLEKMLLAVQADAHDSTIFDEASNSADVATTLAVKKAVDLIEIAKRRSRLVAAANLFADPAWFILLDLFVRQHSGLNTGVSSACRASFSPVTTALRHIAIMTEHNIIVRRFDPRDQRRVYLELTEETKQEIQRILLTDN
jgi:hypothetical protein